MTTNALTWHTKHKQSLTRGARAADIMRNGMGSWPFVGGFIGVMIVWAVINMLLPRDSEWDPYPFILLNLFLSMLAGLQGAILLIAAKRQDGIAAALAQHDYDTNLEAKADIARLITIANRQTEMLDDLHTLLAAERAGALTPTPTSAYPR
ncbi:hypothetical protein GCM10022381_06410 [Leifsonia kafniensis]|uniref:DUF1003 domain-containing protein n=1 Tax=Leifsonia kafniensis TaxID=475957 RepID=A0ABP7K4D6_9MICO